MEIILIENIGPCPTLTVKPILNKSGFDTANYVICYTKLAFLSVVYNTTIFAVKIIPRPAQET